MESQPDRRAGTALKTDCTFGYGVRDLDSPLRNHLHSVSRVALTILKGKPCRVSTGKTIGEKFIWCNWQHAGAEPEVCGSSPCMEQWFDSINGNANLTEGVAVG